MFAFVDTHKAIINNQSITDLLWSNKWISTRKKTYINHSNFINYIVYNLGMNDIFNQRGPRPVN